MLQKVSPDLMVYLVDPIGPAAAAGTFRIWPTWRFVAETPGLAASIAATEIPRPWAMEEKVSPDTTV